MAFQEYPKALYVDGDPSSGFAMALDAEHEADLREAGYASVGEIVKTPEEVEPDHDALVADAEALGITIDKRWGDKRLAEEIALAKADPV